MYVFLHCMRVAEDYVGVLLLTVTSTLVTYSNLYTYKIMGGCFFFIFQMYS